MKKLKGKLMRGVWISCLGAALILAACSPSVSEGSDTTTEKRIESGATLEETTVPEEDSEILKEIAAVPGRKDEDTKELFGGGEENWTEDGAFYIGRIYEIELFGTKCKLFTTCGEDRTVESVSLWIVSGERDVTDEEAMLWQERISDLMGTEPSGSGEPSEGGSINLRWTANGVAAVMNRMKDILTVSFQPVMGELK